MTLRRLLAVVLLVACGDDDVTDASVDARGDVGLDVGVDARVDAMGVDAMGDTATRDVGLDLGVDAGPPVDPVDGAGAVEVAASEYEGVDFGFLEGPHWREGRLYFSDLAFGRPAAQATVYTLEPPSTVSLFARPSGGANGLATSGEGELVACLQLDRAVGRITDSGVDTLFTQFEGERLNAPNDLVFRADGGWYFTDPGYGSEGAAEMDVRAVYLVRGDELSRVWSGTLTQRPNGVTLSPDEATLYLADTADGVIRAFDVESDGALSGEYIFAEVGSPDGLTVDGAGNVYVASRDGVAVFAPDGTPWGTLSVAMNPANVAFGDADRRTLYITARTTLYRARMPIAGIERR